jgi:hypothetical protein
MSLLQNHYNQNIELPKNNKNLDLIILIMVFSIFSSTLVIMVIKAPISPIFHIHDISFNLDENSRSIELDILNKRGKLEIKKIIINNYELSNFTIKNVTLLDSEKFNCKINYHWKMNELYVIEVISKSGAVSNKTISPSIEPKIDIKINQINTEVQDDFIKFNVNYNLSSTGTDMIKTILFSYNSYNISDREIYLFYDELFMGDESIDKANTIIMYFNQYDLNITKIDYDRLDEISKLRPKIILIFINPLKNENNQTVDNAIISPLIDYDEDGFVKNNSIYNKSILYDWMMDDGLVFISIGSVKPYSNILSQNREIYSLKDSNNSLNKSIFLPISSAEGNIINSNFHLSEYFPSRISKTLELSRRTESFGYDKNIIEKNGIDYYAYCDYKLYLNDNILNLTLPVFIPVGEGGWLDLGDEEHIMDKEHIAHDLFMLYFHSIWDSEWIPYGWYWDSGSSVYNSTGKININGNLNSENVPSNIINGKVCLKIITFAYNQDLSKGVFTYQIQKDFTIENETN